MGLAFQNDTVRVNSARTLDVKSPSVPVDGLIGAPAGVPSGRGPREAEMEVIRAQLRGDGGAPATGEDFRVIP
jgi:hypothetical protein